MSAIRTLALLVLALVPLAGCAGAGPLPAGGDGLLLGLVVGVRAGILVYILALSLVLRSPTNLWLAAMVAAGLVQIACDEALAGSGFHGGATLSRVLAGASLLLAHVGFIGFMASFLRLRTLAPRLFRAASALMAALALAAAASVADALLEAGVMTRLLGLARIGTLALTLLSIVAVARTDPLRSLAFLLAWSPAMMTLAMRAIEDLVPRLVFGQSFDAAALIGVTVSSMLFALLASIDVQRRETEMKTDISRNADRFRAFAEIGTDAFWEIDAGGCLSFLAGRPVRLAALRLGEPFLDVVERSTSPEAAAPVRAAVENGLPFDDARLRLAERSDRDVWISLSGRPIAGADGEADGAVYRGLIRDVTEEVERESRRVIEQQMFALGQLAGSVAHEINNLIHPIINLTKRLRVRNRAFDDKEGDRMMDLIDLSSRQAAKVVSELLQTMRGERLKDIDRPLPSAVEQALEAIRPALPSSVRVELATEDMEAPMVRIGDILQVIGNLVSNGVHAMNGQGTIRVALLGTETGVKLTVADDGSGMEERVRLRALQPFFSTKTDGRGTGVGLYIVQRIVGDYGGWINIESALGQGTTVTIFFPFRKDDHGE